MAVLNLRPGAAGSPWLAKHSSGRLNWYINPHNVCSFVATAACALGDSSLFAGPIIAREVLTTPRPLRYYLWRASFACFLFIILWTAWQAIVGWQNVIELGVLARFGAIVYWMFAMLQLTLMLFFAPLFTASAVSYEKDRRTFTLLLMTDLSDLEIVLGKLVAGLLNILTILAASLGLLSICAFFGGISYGQVANLFAVTAASGVAGGALGLLIALWRDRTFQAISLTILMVVFSVAGVEAFAIAFPDAELMGVPLVEVLNPYRAMMAVLYPPTVQATGVVRASSLVYIGCRLTFAAALVAFGTWKLRKWNPGRNEPRELREEGEVEATLTLVEVEEEPAEVALAALARQGPRSGPSRRQARGARGPSLPPPPPRRRPPRPTAARSSPAQRPACTSPDALTAESPRRFGRTAIPGPTRSSGASS